MWISAEGLIDPTCLVSADQAIGGGGVMGGEMFGTVWVPSVNHGLNATAYPSIVADHVHPIMATMYHLLMATCSMIMDLVTKQKRR